VLCGIIRLRKETAMNEENANKKLHICIISLLVAILAVASVSLGILISGHDAEKSDVTSEAKAEAFQNALNAYKIYLNNYGESTCCYWSDGIFTFCNTNDEWQECSKKHNHKDDLDISGWQNGEPGKLEMSKALQEVRNAYIATLANDLATADTSDDVVYNKGTIKVIVGDYLVTITENGSATVAKTTDIASHEIDSATGLLKAASGS
jgi:hypothetical protein